jgi:hypothetical protein
MARMVRKQVYLSPQQNVRLRRAAVRLRRTEADVLRTALDRLLGEDARVREQPARDPLWDILGIAESRDGDLSQRIDEALYGAPRR